MKTDIDFEPAWLRQDAKQVEEAKAFWIKHRLLPPELAEWRAENNLVALARIKGKVVGVSTAQIEYQPPLRGRFAYYRCAVAPDYRVHAVAYRMTGYARGVLEDWSRMHPEEQVLGLFALIEAPELNEFKRRPTWPEYGLHLNLVGYTGDGEQIRVAWFDHARVE